MTRYLLLLALFSLCAISVAADCPVCGLPRCEVDHAARSGNSHLTNRFAIPSNTSRYSGGIVGGGAVIGGGDPCVDEGTWGWDYSGLIPIKRVWLNWSRHRYQASGGKYVTDGPKLR